MRRFGRHCTCASRGAMRRRLYSSTACPASTTQVPATSRLGFKQGLRDNGLRAFMGDDAPEQPGALQELMLHETAVTRIRVKLRRCKPTRPWLETVEQYRARLKSVVAAINEEHDVEGLCWELPERVDKLRLAKGVRLPR